MKAALLFTGSGPLVILTSHTSLEDPVLLGKLRAKGIDKFIAYEVPVETAEQRYGGHFHFTFGQGVFKDDLCVATAESVGVQMNKETRRSEPLTAAMTAWLEERRR